MPTPRKNAAAATRPASRTSGRTTVGAINIRVRPDERALIDQAAMMTGKSRSEFMLEASRRAAADALLDRSLFRVDPKAMMKFQALLEAPAQPNERLRKLLASRAPWD